MTQIKKRNKLIKALSFFILFIVPIQTYAQSTEAARLNRQIATQFRYHNPDSAKILYQQCVNDFLFLGDTLKTIRNLIDLSRIYTSQANYSKSYDGFWEALILCDKINDSTLKGEIHDGIALLYSLFKRKKEAVDYYYKSIRLKRALSEQGVLELTSLVNSYYLLAIHYRERGYYTIAQQYIDSCRFIKNSAGTGDSHSSYLNAEQGYIYFKQNRIDEAEALLLSVEDYFIEKNKQFLVILYYFLGDVYSASGKVKLSENYYLKSIEHAKLYKGHQNFVPQVYENLSRLYYSVGKSRDAFIYMDKARQLNDSLFGARSVNNKSLLEIKDQYRIELDKQQKLVEQARMNELEHNEHVWFLKNIILSVSLGSLLIFIFIFIRYLKNRHRTEQLILRNNQLVNDEKNKEILEVKNKELTTSALQLIEKDELLLEIKSGLEEIKNKENAVNLNSIISKIKTNNKQDWKEFNTRFTAVNENFYKTLSNKFPELSQRDHKICALIKLNFSSKDMAQLLGISLESVHTSRYRVRKKMKLDKGDNLTEFIARL